MTRRLERDERGVVLPLVAIFLVVIVAAAALGIDISNIVQKNRQLQKLADLAALDASRVLDGSANALIFHSVCQAALASARSNGYTGGGDCNSGDLVVHTGIWDPTARTFTPVTAPTDVPNAVQVTASESIPYFFRAGSQIDSRSGVAMQMPTAGVEIGTFATATGSPLFCLIADALATGPCTTSGNYSTLAAATVSVDQLAAAGGYGSADSLLVSDISFAQLASLVAAADPADATTVRAMQPTGSQVRRFALGTILAGFQGSALAASAELDVLDLMMVGAQTIDGGGAISISDFGVSFPGITSASATINAIQAPAFSWGPLGTTAATSQVDVTLNLEVVGTDMSVQVSGNSGTAIINQIACGDPATVQIIASSEALTAKLLGQTVTIAGAPSTPLNFTPPSPAQTIGPTTDLAGQLPVPAPVQQAIGQVLDPLLQALGVQVGGATVDSPAVTPPATLCAGPLLVL